MFCYADHNEISYVLQNVYVNNFENQPNKIYSFICLNTYKQYHI